MSQREGRPPAQAAEQDDWWTELYAADAADTGGAGAEDSLDDRFASITDTVGSGMALDDVAAPASGTEEGADPQGDARYGRGAPAQEGDRAPGPAPDESAAGGAGLSDGVAPAGGGGAATEVPAPADDDPRAALSAPTSTGSPEEASGGPAGEPWSSIDPGAAPDPLDWPTSWPPAPRLGSPASETWGEETARGPGAAARTPEDTFPGVTWREDEGDTPGGGGSDDAEAQDAGRGDEWIAEDATAPLPPAPSGPGEKAEPPRTPGAEEGVDQLWSTPAGDAAAPEHISDASNPSTEPAVGESSAGATSAEGGGVEGAFGPPAVEFRDRRGGAEPEDAVPGAALAEGPSSNSPSLADLDASSPENAGGAGPTSSSAAASTGVVGSDASPLDVPPPGRSPSGRTTPAAYPLADPDSLADLVPDTVLDGAEFGATSVRTASWRGLAGRRRGLPRGEALLTARFGSGEDALLLVALTAGPVGIPGAHRAAREACHSIGQAIGRSQARLLEDIRAGRRAALKSGLSRLADRSYGKLRAQAAALGLAPDVYTAELRCLLIPGDPACALRVFFGVGDGGLFRLRDGEWQDIEPLAAPRPVLADAAAAQTPPGGVRAEFGRTTDKDPRHALDSRLSSTDDATPPEGPTEQAGQEPPQQRPGTADFATLPAGVPTTAAPGPGGLPDPAAAAAAVGGVQAEPSQPRTKPFRFRATEARAGDVLLLCSPGLSGLLRDRPALTAHLRTAWPPEAPAPSLARFHAAFDADELPPEDGEFTEAHPEDRTVAAVWEERAR